MADAVCPRCGHSADMAEFQKAAAVAKRSQTINSAFSAIKKVDPTLSSREALAMASEVHRIERRQKLGW